MNRRVSTRDRMKKELIWLAAVIFSFWTAVAVLGQTNYSQSASTPTNSWAVKMFTEAGTVMDHNFGDLALHAEAEHHFLFRNLYNEDVEITDAQSSCGCTMVKVSKKIIKTGETAEIIAKVDTSGKVHIGKRKVTVTVFFKKPYFAEVQLHVQSVIRSDVVFEPGVVEFGGVGKGNKVVKTVYLQYNGASMNWRVTSLKKTSPAIRAEAKLVKRQKNLKTYEIKIELLESAEPGYINDLLHFATSDSGTVGSVFIPIHGLVFAPLSVKPSYLQFGVVHPGESVRQNLVIRGSMPFKIERVTSTDSRIQFKTANQASIVHVIPVTFNADTASSLGEFRPNITVKTSLNELPDLTIDAYGVISEKEKGGEETVETTDSTISNPSEIYIRRMLASWKEHRSQSDSPALGGFDDPSATESQMAELFVGKEKESVIPTAPTTVAAKPSSGTVIPNDSESPAIPGFTDLQTTSNDQKTVSIRPASEKSPSRERDSRGNIRSFRKATKRSLAPQAIEVTEKIPATAPEEAQNEPVSSSTIEKTTFKVSRPLTEKDVKGRKPFVAAGEGEDGNVDDLVDSSDLSYILPGAEPAGVDGETNIPSDSATVAETKKKSSPTESQGKESVEAEGWIAVSTETKQTSLGHNPPSESVPASPRLALKGDLWKGTVPMKNENRLLFRKPTMK